MLTTLTALGVGAIVTLSASVACIGATQNTNKTGFTNDAVLIVPGATKVERGSDYDGSLKYEINESYPAPQTMAMLERQLGNGGWEPTRENLFNQKPDSRVGGWTAVDVDGQSFFTMSRYWRNESGAYVLLNCRYLASHNETTLTAIGPAHIEAIFFSQATAATLRKGIKGLDRKFK